MENLFESNKNIFQKFSENYHGSKISGLKKKEKKGRGWG